MRITRKTHTRIETQKHRNKLNRKRSASRTKVRRNSLHISWISCLHFICLYFSVFFVFVVVVVSVIFKLRIVNQKHFFCWKICVGSLDRNVMHRLTNRMTSKEPLNVSSGLINAANAKLCGHSSITHLIHLIWQIQRIHVHGAESCTASNFAVLICYAVRSFCFCFCFSFWAKLVPQHTALQNPNIIHYNDLLFAAVVVVVDFVLQSLFNFK